MNTSRIVLLILCTISVAVTACQPSAAKRSGRKVRVKDGTRSKQHYNFTDSQKATGEQSSAEGVPTETPKATIDTNNALCDRVVEGKCDAIRVIVLEDGTFEGMDRKEAANAGNAKTITDDEETVNGKNVEIKIKFDDVKNRGTKLTVAAVASDDSAKEDYDNLFKSLDLSNVSKKVVSATPTAEEVETVKALVKTPKDKVLVVAKTQEKADAAKTAIGVEDTMTLITTTATTTRILREELLSLAGSVVPVNFVTRHSKDQIAMNTLKVTLNGRALDVSEDFGTSYREKSSKFRIYLIKRELLNANSELKITYSLK